MKQDKQTEWEEQSEYIRWNHGASLAVKAEYDVLIYSLLKAERERVLEECIEMVEKEQKDWEVWKNKQENPSDHDIATNKAVLVLDLFKKELQDKLNNMKDV